MASVKNDDIRVEIATAAHRDGILFVAQHSFVKGEPVRAHLGITWDSCKEEWEEFVDDCLQHPYSHVAVAGSTVVGIRLSRIMNLDDYKPDHSFNDFMRPGHIKNIEDICTQDWDKVLIDENGKPCKKVLHFLALSVLPEYGGKGIARRMSDENIEMGKRLGCEYCCVVASNWVSQRLFHKMGFVTRKTFLYADYRDEHGETPLKPDPQQPTAKWQVMKF